jgi:hypothetical protein
MVFHATGIALMAFANLLLSLTLVVALARLDSYMIPTMTGRLPQEWRGVFGALVAWRRSGEPAPVWLVQAIAWPIVLCALFSASASCRRPTCCPAGSAAGS